MQRQSIGTAAFVLGLLAALLEATALIVSAVTFTRGSGTGSGPSDQNYGAGIFVIVIEVVLFLVISRCSP